MVAEERAGKSRAGWCSNEARLRWLAAESELIGLM
jgi:hypothetical protein